MRSAPVQRKSDERTAPPLIHTYPTPRGRDPRIGDVALCGYVKRAPHQFARHEEPSCATCVVCAEMEARR